MDTSQLMLTGKVAVVTGAARGIGKATALAFADLGATVAVCDLLHDELDETVNELRSKGAGAYSEVIDVRDGEAVTTFFAAVSEELGSVDVLVNNAGGGFWAPFDQVSEKGESVLIRENFGSVTNCVRASLPILNDGASIVNVTSVEAYHSAPGFAVYAAMKAAVQQFTQSLAVELGSKGIRLSLIHI